MEDCGVVAGGCAAK